MKTQNYFIKNYDNKKGKVNNPFLLILLVCSCYLSAQQNVVNLYGRLQVNGSHVTAENGKKISIAGNSLFWSNAGDTADYYNEETVNHLATDWKSSIVRIALGVKESWDGGNGYINSPNVQKAKIKKVIDAAIAQGVYVIVDWHSHNAENYQSEAVAFFSEIAELYGDKDNIIYEIYNEPLNTTAWSTVKNYAAPVIAAIRNKDPDNLIIVGTPTWCQDVDKAAADPITGDSNLAYTLHFYANSHKGWLRDRAVAAMNSGIALFVTEWGSVDASGNGGFNPGESDMWIDFMKDNFISHVNWNVSDKNETSSIVSPSQGLQGLLNNNLSVAGVYIKGKILEQAPTLSVKDFKIGENTISIYPNPTSDVLKIDTTLSIDKLSIFSITGKLILTKNMNQEKPQIDLTHLSSGNYILKVFSGINSASTKFVKL